MATVRFARLAALALLVAGCGGAVASGDGAAPSSLSHRDRAAAAANPVTVSPLPGTPDASPTTQISFLGSGPLTVTGVRVVGSRSGSHSGHLEAYSTGDGASFLVNGAFTAGEHVSVQATVNGALAQTSFEIAHQATVSQAEFPNNPGDPRAVQHYASAPALTPSKVTITVPQRSGASPGDFLLAPYQGEGSPGPMIMDGGGNLVWFHPLPAGDSSTNLQAVDYEGQPDLAFWQGRIIRVGYGEGEDLIYNDHYQQVAVVRAGNGYHADLHEIHITPQGTAWLDVFDPIDYDLAPEHGDSHGILLDSVIEEIDIRTGLVMWEWHALGHIAVRDSDNGVPRNAYPFDYIHINSVDPGTSGDVLLSARNTWTLYDVNMRTGAFNWEIGPRPGDLSEGSGVRFYWQHDAQFEPGGLISVFDNGSTPPKEKQSRGLLLRPDFGSRSVSLVKAFTNPAHVLLASSQGSLLPLPGGNWLMGYGGLPNFTEYSASGRVLFDATFGRNVQDFRTYFTPSWTGLPLDAPSIAVRPTSGGRVAVFASWNGATDVASWRVLADGTAVGTASRRGFETVIAVPAGSSSYEVQALGSGGQVLGTSGPTSG